jgi:hypothetical protein
MLEVNCTPLSEIKTAGIPNLLTHPAMNAAAQSAVDTVFSGMASAHQLPSFFRTKCRGLDHWLDERRMIPARSILSNSTLAVAILVLSSLRNFAAIGGPSVTIWCLTPCDGWQRLSSG